MLIGPARDGAPLEIGVLDLNGEDLADNLDPASVAPEDLSDLRAVAEAAEQVRRDEALVTERVAAARARGRSWNRIAVALGVSRQAARHRFADKVG
jgi:hypothetical protein